MVRKKTILFLCLLTIGYTVIDSVRHNAQSSERNEFQTSQDEVGCLKIYGGIRVWVGSNRVHSVLRTEMRDIFILLERDSFTEDKLKTIFTRMAEEYPQPIELWIHAYSEKGRMEKMIDEQLNPPPQDMIPQKSDITNQVAVDTLALKSGFTAMYSRRVEEERFSYGLDTDKKEGSIVVLRAKKIPYTGDLDSDLVLAAEEGDKSKVLEMLAKGANINAKDKYGMTPLICSASRRDNDLVMTLLGMGADVDARDLSECTALTFATTGDAVETVKLLLSNGADVNAKCDDGTTPLALAATKGYLDLVKVLLSNGAKVHVEDNDGNTPLMNAVLNNKPEVVSLLIEWGARIDIRNKKGETPMSVAQRQQWREMAKLLRKASVKQ